MKRIFLVALTLVVLVATAAAATVAAEKTYPYYNITFEIENGQCAPINSTVDISSMGWNVPYLAYYGKWETSFSPDTDLTIIKTIKLLDVRSSKTELKNTLTHFYIDPEIFSNYPGYWYQYYGEDSEDYERAGNLRAFYVNETCQEVPEQKVYMAKDIPIAIAANFTETETIDWLPDKHEADILVSRGEKSMPIPENDILTWWVFGTKNKIYDQDMDEKHGLVIDTNGLQPGRYDVVIVSPGKNGIMEEEYIESFKPGQFQEEQPAIVSPFRDSIPVLLKGLDPLMVEEKLKEMISKSHDDTIFIMSMMVQEPEIQIKRIDATHDSKGNTWYNVRGYTNLADGTTLTIKVDADKITPQNRKTHQFTTVAKGVNPGSWREFNAEIPINYDEIGPGHHDITVSAPNDGAETTTGIYVYQDQENSYVPPEYTEYLGTDPFITPEIVTVTITIVLPTPPPQKIIQTIPVTPSNEQVRAQQEDIAKDWAIKTVGVLIFLYVTYRVARYGISVFRRARLKP